MNEAFEKWLDQHYGKAPAARMRKGDPLAPGYGLLRYGWQACEKHYNVPMMVREIARLNEVIDNLETKSQEAEGKVLNTLLGEPEPPALTWGDVLALSREKLRERVAVEICEFSIQDTGGSGKIHGSYYQGQKRIEPVAYWQPDREWEDLGMVIEAMREKGWRREIHVYAEGYSTVCWWGALDQPQQEELRFTDDEGLQTMLAALLAVLGL